MTPTKPLAEAQRRLGRPGRPRKTPAPVPAPVAAVGSARPSPGRERPGGPLLQRRSGGDGTATGPLLPRLLDQATAAQYLGISARTLRTLVSAGTLARVEIPLGPAGQVRKVLFDRVALDRLVETWARG